MMRTSIFLILGLIILNGSKVLAKDSRFFGMGGFGQARATSAGVSNSSRTQSPGGFSFAVDQNLFGSYYIFVEHMRSFGSTGTSVGMTGLGIKYYPWLNPQYVRNVNVISGRSLITFGGYFPYGGISGGFAQASMLGSSNTDDILAVGGYVAAKLGVELPFSETWGLACEYNFGTSIMGSGSIQVMNVIFGGYLAF